MLSLKFLENFSDEDAIDYLTSLDGVGSKSSRCVLLFSLDRDVIPVDTHVFRVSKRLGLVDPKLNNRDKACEHLESLIEPEHRYRLHMCLIYQGRRICKARKPKCDKCHISSLCDYDSKTL